MKKNLIKKVSAGAAAAVLALTMVTGDMTSAAVSAYSSPPAIYAVPDVTGMPQRDAVIAVAESQLGYKAGSGNYSAFLKDYGPWCAAYASWAYSQVLDSSQYGGREIQTYCPTWKDDFGDSFVKRDDYTPQKGDLCFFDFNLNSVPDHVGIVYEDSNGRNVKTIEGNFSTKQTVSKRSFSTSWSYILGYGKINFDDSNDNQFDPIDNPTNNGSSSLLGKWMVNTSLGLNVRSKASTSSSRLGAAKNGTEFTVTAVSSDNQWGYCKIYCTNGWREGWVCLSYAKQLTSTEPSTTKTMRGDLNNDGKISITDVVKMDIYLENPTENVSLDIYDVTEDGTIDQNDREALRLYVVKLISDMRGYNSESRGKKVILHTNMSDYYDYSIDVSSGSYDSEIPIISWSTHKGSNQIFELIPYDSNYYYIKLSYTDKYWNINRGGNYGVLQTYDFCDGAANMLFQLIDAGNGRYYIKDKEGFYLLLDTSTGDIHTNYDRENSFYLTVSLEYV